ncbi:hypothetical protein [Subtercola lobariae]|uniref:Type IV secretion protein Rhs n=1 Tax=Subtercola lobariae TaxID=1588641 RepID=A0A917F0D5_9MICO|nr:hypothetical protein [Subtercola lobariae]GGF35849.1 hypothetical protein GCM10011399_31040 [Subtercola lobariae]
MRTKKTHRSTIRESGGVGNWLNGRLFPYLGPPPLGPFDTESAESKAQAALARACPLCGNPMSEHVVDRSGERTQLYCPHA